MSGSGKQEMDFKTIFCSCDFIRRKKAKRFQLSKKITSHPNIKSNHLLVFI